MEHDQSRREFMKTVAVAGAAMTIVSGQGHRLFAQTAAPAWEVPKGVAMVKLPYAESALAPAISANTINLHYHKHHEGYYTTLKDWIGAHEEFQNQSLEQLIKANQNGIRFAEGVFNYSVLLNNHNWYWLSLKPNAGGAPKGKIGKMVDASYGGYDAFKKAFIEAGMELGVGWVWVVKDGESVKVYRSEYRDTPILKGYRPLLAVDVWEHAYYLDYENERGKYLDAVLGKLLNWDFAEANLAERKK